MSHFRVVPQHPLSTRQQRVMASTVFYAFGCGPVSVLCNVVGGRSTDDEGTLVLYRRESADDLYAVIPQCREGAKTSITSSSKAHSLDLRANDSTSFK
jgi:hypothetical protein